jgi:hypothetical protein
MRRSGGWRDVIMSIRSFSIVSEIYTELKRVFKAKQIHIAYTYVNDPPFAYDPITKTIFVSLKFVDYLLENLSEEIVKCFVKSLLVHEIQHHIDIETLRLKRKYKEYRELLEESAFKTEIDELLKCLNEI